MSKSDRYSGISIINHWVTAFLVVAMLVLGFSASAASDDTIEEYIMSIHIALGFFVFIFVIWRVLFRLYEGFPQNIGKTMLECKMAYFVHRTILIILLIQVATGPLYLFTENECIHVFGWFSICLPLASLSLIHEPMEWMHVVTGLYILPVLLILHFFGAIRHYTTKGSHETPADM